MLRGSTNAEKIWNFCKDKGMNNFGAAGTLGNLDAESGLDPCNMEDFYQRKLGMSDKQYVTGVDNGTYTNFVKDGIGVGICQWTHHTRKAKLLEFAKGRGDSIGDLEMQLEFLYYELSTSYVSLLNTLKTATSIGQASNAFLMKFECPADMGTAVQMRRASMANTYYQRFVKGQANGTTSRLLVYGCEGDDVEDLQNKLIKLGYSCGALGADGEYGPSTVNAVKKFQRENRLTVDGIAGALTIGKINSLYAEIDDTTSKVIVTASALNVRAGAGTNYKAVSYVRKGAVCELLEVKGIWGKIKQPEGWICMDYVQKV